MRKLTSTTGRDILLKPVRPNKGIEMAYRRKLRAMVESISNSVEYWITAEYRKHLPQIANDGPVEDLQSELDRLSKQWLSKFDKGALNLAEWFARKTKSYSDGTLKSILQESGFTVKFSITPEAQTVYDAIVAENVSLIKSIPEKYLSDVEGLVMRSVAAGRDLESLTKSIKARYGITDRRAKLIAKDQNNKATSAYNTRNQLDLGLEDAEWIHSRAGKVPRISHVHANGKRYKIAKGMLIEGEYIYPGEKINCRCVARGLIPGDIG